MPHDDARLTLFGYFRSSASYRVRIALHLKGLPFAFEPVHLTRDGGEQHRADFRQRSPYGLVPLLVDGEQRLSQSMAIIEYLDERFPNVPLLPGSASDRARVRRLSQAIACEAHPVTNLRVLQHLGTQLGLVDAARGEWARHWTALSLSALESDLAGDRATGRFCHGDQPTMADCCLVPLLFNARRFGVDMAAYPRLASIDRACQSLDAFARAHPDAQPDAA